MSALDDLICQPSLAEMYFASWKAAMRINAELQSELDAIFHEFTDDMEDDGWEATMEWLRKDFPHLATRWERFK